MNSFPFRGDMDSKSIICMLEDWITSPELKVLVQSFGGNLEVEKTIVEHISDIEKIRWTIMNEGLSSEQQKLILAAARKLGLMGCTIPSKKVYDYILVLGGTGMSCLLQMKYAKEICEKYSISVSHIIGLAGMRSVMKSERIVTDTYAPNAKTEFDLMKAAVLNVYDSFELKDRKEYISENSNKSWIIEAYNNIPIMLFAAPSEEPERRRADMTDKYSFFMKQLKVGCGVNLLLVTSEINVPCQQIEAIRLLGIPYNHSVETIGFPDEWSDGLQNLRKPENYLQELLCVLQAMERLLEIFA